MPRVRRMGVSLAMRAAGTGAMLLALSACATGGKFAPVRDTPVRIGRPYQVRGKTFTPAAAPNYDVLGYASWYGNESGNRTANGERFRANWITAAHTTLPLPTYVEVTALDTGNRIIVRVNDRGPFVTGPRIIDLSRGAAEELGMLRQGTAKVRVRRIDVSGDDAARLRKGKPARPLPKVPEEVLRSLRGRLATGGY